MSELRLCPFCGGNPVIEHKGNDYTKKRSITIKCKSCRVQRTDSALRNSMEWLEKVSIENWNNQPRFAAAEARVRELESAINSVNRGKEHFLEIGEDNDPCYWQRKEWVDWIIDLTNQEKGDE